MRYITQLLVIFTLLVFVASCSDQLVEPDTQARVAGEVEMVAVPFQIDANAVTPGPSTAKSANSDCTFTTKGNTMKLDADCTTDATIVVPEDDARWQGPHHHRC